MEEISDECLLDLYFVGDAEAFQVFFNRHSGRIVGYAMSKGLNFEIAYEVRQEAFLRLHKSIHTYEKGRPALPWFFTIVHNCIVDAMRQRNSLIELRKRASREFPDRPLTQNVTEAPTPLLAKLSDEQRRVVEMRVFDDLSFSEISAETGKSEVSLRKTFERARKKLKEFLLGEG